MDIRLVEEKLRDYKRKKAIIETTLLRIETYKQALAHPEIRLGLFLHPSRDPSMPMTKGYNTTSVVEYEVITHEEQNDILKDWIKDEKSRIYPYQVEKEQLDAALSSLNKQQRFIIECKYFEDMFWRDIEINYNDSFRQQNYITVEGIRKINRQALDTLCKILKIYYRRYKTV